MLTVQVAYGEPAKQVAVEVTVPRDANASAALSAASDALRAAFPDVDFAALALAVWGEAATPDTPLRDGDRLELLRPLIADPKLTRRRRADANAKRKPPGSVFRR